jgi:hypothetical protein
MSMKNSSDTIGNRTHDLLVCSTVPQTTAPLRPLYGIKDFEISLRVGLFQWTPIHFQWWWTYLWFGAVCVYTIDGKFDVFHFTAICYWRQFDDSMEWNIQIWQLIWKSNVFFPSKLLAETLNWHHNYELCFCIAIIKQTAFILQYSAYSFTLLKQSAHSFLCKETIWPRDFMRDLKEPRMSSLELHVCASVYFRNVWVV